MADRSGPEVYLVPLKSAGPRAMGDVRVTRIVGSWACQFVDTAGGYGGEDWMICIESCGETHQSDLAHPGDSDWY